MRQSRRSFLGLRSNGGADSAGVATPSAGQAPAPLAPRLVPRLAPRLATDRCNGCDACASLCPTGALALRRDEAGLAYRLAIGACTGCGDCVEACDVGAITLVGGAGAADDWRVALTEHTCRRCGAAFHLPAAEAQSGALCRICERKSSNLFQVR